MKTNTKHCNTCDTTKTVDQFSKDRSKSDGLQSKCKDCKRASNRVYRKANREEILARKRNHYQANREVLLAKSKSYQEANREKIAEYQKVYRSANRDMTAERERNRRANDPVFRQVRNTRRNLRKILHGTGSHQPTLDLLGCTGPEWRAHLESLWTKGMSWDNYGHGEGKWQCDHIIPISSFDQTKTDERKICWNYLNTQPLWAKDNQAKGSTIPTESTNE